MVDMDYLNIDMNICQLLLLRITTKTYKRVGPIIKFIINKGIMQRKFIFQFF